MIIERDHPAFIQPDERDTIWRYISLEKFESSIKRNALFFCRADRFSDPFEGSIPKKEAEFRINDQERISGYYGNSFNRIEAEKNVRALSETHKKFKKASIVNCWHINDNESDGMWQLYLKSNEGVAIKSSVDRIIKAFEKTNENIYLSRVRYIDYENAIWYHEKEYPCWSYNFLTPIVHKRIEFSHETELRLLYNLLDAENDEQYWLKQEFEKGLFISVDLDILVDEIVLPPTSDSYIESKVKEIMNKYGLNKVIKKSKLSSEPIY